MRETDGDQEESNKLCPKCTPTHPIPVNTGIHAGYEHRGPAEEPFGRDTLRGVDICPHGPGRMNCEHEDCIEWRSHGRAR